MRLGNDIEPFPVCLVSRVVSGFAVEVRDNKTSLLPCRWCFARGMGLVYAH